MKELTEQSSTEAALTALEYGYQPIPIRDGGKAPMGSGWQRTRWTSEEEVREAFESASANGASGIGLLLGEPSGGLVDVDLDHHHALRLRDHFLPPSDMATGREGRALSHRWYIVADDPEVMETRRYKLPDGQVSVELRWTGTQTVIPPSTHPSGERYRWEGDPWGKPARVSGRRLSIQVALLGLGAVLLDAWPETGSRHEAYLALAGGLLRYGDGVHPYWERNLPVLIGAIADATHDDDGAETRIRTVMGTTLDRLRQGREATGFNRLGEMIGLEHMEAVRRMAKEVESRSGFVPGASASPGLPTPPTPSNEVREQTDLTRSPMEERVSSWAAVDLGPYLSGEIEMPEPTLLRRADGAGLFYPGRVNSLFGSSESAKSWIALTACVQEMARGERVVYVDLEDEPAGAVVRLRALGAADEDITKLFRYVHPDGPIAAMQRYAYGDKPTAAGDLAQDMFHDLLESFDPTLIVADGMTVLYGLHGHDTNAATSTDVITSWLKSLTRGGRTGVIVIDHTGKVSGPGTSPIGAHHKVAMVQGSALRADAVDRPVPGGVGTVRLVVYKDRPGAVREVSSTGTEQLAALFRMDSREEGVTKVEIESPPEGTMVIGDSPAMEAKLEQMADSQEVLEALLDHMAEDPEAEYLTADVAKDLEYPEKSIRETWRVLRDTGLVEMRGSRRWAKYVLTEKGKADLS